MKFTGIMILLLLLPFSAVAGTFLETFDDRELQGWQELTQLNNPSGSWEIIDDELHAVSRKTFLRLLTTGDNTWENYTIKFDVKPLKKHGISNISIAARVKGTWLIYCSIADPVVLVDGEPLHESRMSCAYGNLHDVIFLTLHTEPHPLLKLNKWAHLKLSVDGNMVAFWVNEKQVMKPTAIRNLKDVQHGGHNFNFAGFPDFRTGSVGFGLANYTARFDNITVTGDTIPNSGGFAVTPQEKVTTTWAQLKQF